MVAPLNPMKVNVSEFGASLPSGEAQIGKVGATSKVIDITLVLDTAIYASGDVLAITALLGNFARVIGGTVTILGLQVLDEAKQNGAFDLIFFKSMVDVGTINNPYDITAAEAREILGQISVAAADYTTWTNHSMAYIKMSDAGMKMIQFQAPADSKDVYIAAISRDAKTYSAASLKLKLAVIQD